MGLTHVFNVVNERVVINFIERFTEVHDNDISLLTLILTVCYFLCEANRLSLTAVFWPESVLLRAKYVMSVMVIYHGWHNDVFQ